MTDISAKQLNIDKLIQKIKPVKRKVEKLEHIELLKKKYGECNKCNLCGGESGTLKIIQHTYKCMYYINETNGPFIVGNIKNNSNIDTVKILTILQREYGEVDKTTEKSIIGSYGAGPCFIICMRNRFTYKSTLAHIDTLTQNPLEPFEHYEPNQTDVYIIGGDNSSKTQIHDILILLKEKKHGIKCANIITNNSNKFAIDSISGKIYMDENINIQTDDPQLSNQRIQIMKICILMNEMSKLQKIE